MRYSVCGEYAINVSEGIELIPSQGLTIECDCTMPLTVTAGDGSQFCAVFADGKVLIPRDFISAAGRFTVQFGSFGGSAFLCFYDDGILYASRCTDSLSDEITHMWMAIAGIMSVAQTANNIACAASLDVEKFSKGYITE
ncbi:MAG: hypothetical protein MJ101_03800 [Clostridia bacterium]|nr:hypothetical protein [Clostridia bacterium]